MVTKYKNESEKLKFLFRRRTKQDDRDKIHERTQVYPPPVRLHTPPQYKRHYVAGKQPDWRGTELKLFECTSS